MLVLMCHVGDQRYAIDSADVIEVAPLVNFDTLADMPQWAAGVFAHRGQATPLADLSLLLAGRPCPRRYSSRIILVRSGAEDTPNKIGLLAARVTTVEIQQQPPTTSSSTMNAVGPILFDEHGMFQLVDLARLLNAQRRGIQRPAREELSP